MQRCRANIFQSFFYIVWNLAFRVSLLASWRSRSRSEESCEEKQRQCRSLHCSHIERLQLTSIVHHAQQLSFTAVLRRCVCSVYILPSSTPTEEVLTADTKCKERGATRSVRACPVYEYKLARWGQIFGGRLVGVVEYLAVSSYRNGPYLKSFGFPTSSLNPSRPVTQRRSQKKLSTWLKNFTGLS